MSAAKTKEAQPLANGKAGAAIAVEKIVKKYGDFEAVKGVSFEVAKGRYLDFWAQTAPGRARSSA
jgi:ABC-2 type transport system ATP-binding protein